jgi:phosphoserine aminotransferase
MQFFTNFTPGPSQLYFTADDHIRKALREGIPSLSHRSKSFELIYQSAREGLRELLGVPGNWTMLFTSSATEIWERIIQNLVIEQSHHFVNGAFSQRFYEIARQLNRKPSLTKSVEGEGFLDSTVANHTELIALTHNETSTGVSLPVEFINQFRSQYPEAILAVDAVSSLPYPSFDFGNIDTLFFSVQKGFGLPAGLGVWLINDRCLAKAEQMHERGISIGSYHSLPSLAQHAVKNQTPETPNVLGIYVLDKVIQDMLRRGITAIRRETEYKAAILYQALAQHPVLKPFVSNEKDRSRTVIVAECGQSLTHLVKFLNARGMMPGEGYGKLKSHQLRFANFPTHSKEQFELLVDSIEAFTE